MDESLSTDISIIGLKLGNNDHFNHSVSLLHGRFWLSTLSTDDACIFFEQDVGIKANVLSCFIEEHYYIPDMLCNPPTIGDLYRFIRVLSAATEEDQVKDQNLLAPTTVICISPDREGLTIASLLLGGFFVTRKS
jgi:hypothetical protein